jgi:hypothetical protein
MAQTTQRVPPEGQDRPGETIQDVVDHIFGLPFDAQLGVLRTITPKILKSLRREERERYVRDLNREILLADQAEPTYRIRPDIPIAHRPRR